jgi:hypothetical protein
MGRAVPVGRKGDPLYDSDQESAEMQVWTQFEFRQRTTVIENSLNPSYDLREFQDKVDEILTDFFRSHEASECADALAALDCSRMMDEFVVRAVRKSLETKSSDEAQRLTSGLFRLLHARKQLDSTQLARGFDKLSLTWDDLALDVPSAPLSILQYVDCAIMDECLDADFLARLPEPFLRVLSETTAKAGDEVAVQLRGVLTDIQEYKKGAESVAQEAAGATSAEVAKAIADLGMPHLRHEVVRKMVLTTLSRTERERRAVARLLADLRADATLSENHVAVGLTRLVGTMEDLILDAPAAAEHIRKFWAWVVLEELVPPAALQAVRRLRIGGPRGIKLVEEVEAWIADPVVTSSALFSDAVDVMRQNEFREAVLKAISEYFDSVDAPEFARILRTLDLDEAQQRIEIVRKVISGALDRQAKDCHAAVSLLQYLVDQGDLRAPDLAKALQQLRERLPDLKLDVPDAEPILNTFADKLTVQ